jgi:hypothetical protein
MIALARSPLWSTCASARQWLVRRDYGRPALQMPLVDHSKAHVGGIGGVALVAELVNDQDVGSRRRTLRPLRCLQVQRASP